MVSQNDIFPLKLLSLYVGGNMSSKLFIALREKESLVYDVSVMLLVIKFESVEYILQLIQNLNKVIEIIMKELTDIQKRTFTKRNWKF